MLISFLEDSAVKIIKNLIKRQKGIFKKVFDRSHGEEPHRGREEDERSSWSPETEGEKQG